MDQVYLINQTTFLQYEDISVNVKPARLNAFIKKAQDLDLKLFLGYAFYYDVMRQCNPNGSLKDIATPACSNLVNGCEYTDPDGRLIIYDGILPALVYFTLSRFIENDAVKYTGAGPVVKTHDNAQPLAYSDIIKMAQQYRSIANAHLNDTERYLLDNPTEYPLWNYNYLNKNARQPGPRITAVDRAKLARPFGFFNDNPYNLTDGN